MKRRNARWNLHRSTLQNGAGYINEMYIFDVFFKRAYDVDILKQLQKDLTCAIVCVEVKR